MPVAAGFSLIEEILQFIGVFVSFSIAYVAFRGMRKTESSSLLRLATAFAFLGFGFMLQALVGADGLMTQLLPAYTAAFVLTGFVGLLLETVGYFFLAFSHAIDVMLSKRLGLALMVVPFVSLPGLQLVNVLGVLSFYFLLYGAVETLYAYARTHNTDTLLIAGGLGLIGVSTFIELLSVLNPGVELLPLIQIITKEIGLLILFVPVLSYALGGMRKSGPI